MEMLLEKFNTHHRFISIQGLKKVVDSLVEKDIIEKKQNGDLTFKMDLLRVWIQNNKGGELSA